MDALTVVMTLLAFVVGAAAGAYLCWRFAAGSGQAGNDAVARLHDAESSLAAVTAERDALQDRLVDERERSGEERSVMHLLAPLADRLRQVQQQVGVLERDRVEQFGQLSQQLATAAEQDAALLKTTSSLASALSNSATRGTWGEVQLRRVVEAAGMLRHVDFAEQVSGTTHRTAGTRQRPDLVVNLPGGKSVAVDAKVPLNAYLTAQDEDPSHRGNLMRAHAKALRKHVDDLAAKEYWENIPGSPELVICFLPAESFLAAALEADPGLLDDAFSRNVALAAPSTLLSILKGLAYAWRQELLTENAKALFDESRQLYKRLGTLGSHIDDLGKSLKSSVERYNSFVGTLETRVLPSTRRLQELDPGLTSNAAEATPRTVESTPRVLSAAELLPTRSTEN
ncbi:DNA recombination protein RmuC [Zhihengliuella flava]|uniref:DNA recombination protein RmuC n=1 Tax=Zhihengliuella flava TaxID=1285193 RepID=A0A931GG79_9MICC|nr:DNA recombination protein RmuC [Zhihengliuella flava]MBG6085502.1 DNA recombination protein RmuC [Zhihengliuella flava]